MRIASHIPYLLALLSVLLIPASLFGRSYKYDPAGRLVLAVYEDGTALQYIYTSGDNIDMVNRLTLPAAPSNLAAARKYSGTVNLSWDDNAQDETGFRIERRAFRSSDWQSVATLDQNADTFLDTGLDPFVNYVYRIVATSSIEGLDSAYSAMAAASGDGSIAFSIDSIAPLGGDPSRLILGFQSEAGKTYQLQSSNTLLPDSWSPYPWQSSPSGTSSIELIPGQAGTTNIYLSDSSSEATYFRLLIVDP